MTTSKKHHYLPQFYLRGFTNETGEYFVFDKVKNEIRKTKPINTFFENKRNTSQFPDEEDVLIEKLYAHFDTLTAPAMEKFRCLSQENCSICPEALARLKMFIPQIYWRIPWNDDNINRIIDSLAFEATGFKVVDKDGKSIEAELFNRLKNVDLIRKMYPLLIPFQTQKEKYRNTEYETWRVYFRSNQLIGDNPLITKEIKNFGSLTRDIVFPICSNKFLIHTNQSKPTELSPTAIFELDLLMIIQAKRFVCCADENYLRTLVNQFYPIFNAPDMEVEMKKSFFSHFM